MNFSDNFFKRLKRKLTSDKNTIHWPSGTITKKVYERWESITWGNWRFIQNDRKRGI